MNDSALRRNNLLESISCMHILDCVWNHLSHLHILNCLQAFYSEKDNLSRAIAFAKVPTTTLYGCEFGEQHTTVQVQPVGFDDFIVTRIQGRVRWKDLGSGDATSMLLLEVRHADPRRKEIFGTLELCKFARESDDEATITLNMLNPFSGRNTFWGSHKKGKTILRSLCETSKAVLVAN